MSETAPQVSSRIEQPKSPHGRVVLQVPPQLEPSDGMNTLLTMLVPLLGSVTSIVMMLMTNSGITGMLTGGMFLISSVGFVLVNGGAPAHAAQGEPHLVAQRVPLAYLAELRKTVRTAERKQRRSELWNAPAPDALVAIAQETARRWERIPADEDFLNVRIGSMDKPLCITLEAPELPPLSELDPVSASAAHRFMMAHPERARHALHGRSDRIQAHRDPRRRRPGAVAGPHAAVPGRRMARPRIPADPWWSRRPSSIAPGTGCPTCRTPGADEVEDPALGHGAVMVVDTVEEANRLIGEETLHRSPLHRHRTVHRAAFPGRPRRLGVRTAT